MNPNVPNWEPTLPHPIPAPSPAAREEVTPPLPSAPAPVDGRPPLSETLPTDPHTPPVPVPERPSIPGFEILAELGRGGMGVVYKARQLALNRPVALKMILSAQFAGAEELERFRREAEMAARVRHPNVVQVYEVGTHQGRPYLVMEWVNGGSLAARLRDQPPSPRAAAALVEILARAVHVAHAAGVVHRDLKPGNILLRDEGRGARDEEEMASALAPRPSSLAPLTPKITDFGLAKQLNREDGLTMSGAVLGTPGYMAPEQAGAAGRVGPGADIYALGAILYQLLTGRPPFEGATLLEVLEQVKSVEPAPPSRLRAGGLHPCPRDLETICLKCLRKEPARRYATAEALADDLRRYLDGQPIQARPVGRLERGWKWARRRPVFAAGLGATLVVLAAAVAGGLWYWDTYIRVKVAYFNTYVRRWGAYEGVGRLTEEQARHREATFKFSARAGKVDKVEVVNGHGILTGDPEGILLGDKRDPQNPFLSRPECWYQFKWDGEGKVAEQIAYNRLGEKVWSLRYTSDHTGQFTDEHGFPQRRSRYGAAYVEFRRSPEGFDEQLLYLDRDGNPRRGDDDTYGKRFALDGRGLPLAVTCLRRDLQPMKNRQGYAQYRQVCDGLGNATEVVWLDVQGQPVRYAVTASPRATGVYDDYGNVVAGAFLDETGNPLVNAEGVHRWTIRRDEYGNRVDLRYFDGAGQQVLNQSGGYARWTVEYDADGNETRRAFFGAHDEPVNHKEGYHSWAMVHDSRGYPVRIEAFDRAGRPGLFTALQVSGWTTRYDERGNPLEQAYFGTDGRPTLAAIRAAKVTLRYGDAKHPNQPTEEACWGLHGEPVGGLLGWASLRRTYDDQGNTIRETYHGTRAEAVVNDEGIHGWTAQFDAEGNQTELAYLSPKGEPAVPRKAAYARWQAVHDSHGNRLRWDFFGPKGQPVPLNFTAGGEVIPPDLGKDGRARPYRGGFTGWEAHYDRDDHCTERIFRGGAGNDYARLSYILDPHGRLISRTYLDAADQPVCPPRFGYAQTRYLWADDGQLLDLMYFDRQGKSVRTEILVTSVELGGEGQRVGLREGDVLVAYDGHDLTNVSLVKFGIVRDRRAATGKAGPVELRVRRGSQVLRLAVAPGKFGAGIQDRASQSRTDRGP